MRPPVDVTELTALGRVRLSEHFFMREMLYSEVSNLHGVPNLPEDPDLAIEAGRQAIRTTLGRLHGNGRDAQYQALPHRRVLFRITLATNPPVSRTGGYDVTVHHQDVAGSVHPGDRIVNRPRVPVSAGAASDRSPAPGSPVNHHEEHL